MSMITTCPNCHVAFKVTPQQLDAHQGDVRCGKCSIVFNAFDSLSTAVAPQDAQQPDEAIEENQPPQMPAAVEPETPATPSAVVEETVVDEAVAQEVDVVAAKPAPVAARPFIVADFEPFQQEPAAPPRKPRWKFFAWLTAAILLLLLFAAQGIYFGRNQLYTYYPPAKPYVRQLCNVLHCRVALLGNADLIKIESSDLQADPQRPNVVALAAALHNLAPYPQAYPALELTLTDTGNSMVARRVFSPREYLDKAAVMDAGMPVNEEVPVKLALDLGGLNAVGYKLYLFYP